MFMAIIAVGYNRLESLMQLISSLLEADYSESVIDLIVSLDKSDNQQEIIEEVKKVEWPYGEKIIRAFSERQGLRSHIIQCGDFTDKYDAVIVLEDDIMVAPYFLSFVKQTITRFANDQRIAGISLYRHQLNQGVNRPFEPAYNGFDVYLHQYAASWGQCWTKQMWRDFRNWYSKNEDKDLSEGNILPGYISRWNKQSWLKYYMRYIVETGRYFVYPYSSLSTNASEVGEHCTIQNNDYQVSLNEGNMVYRFPSFEEAVKYDVFFERVGIEDKILQELPGKKILDLYGGRIDYKDADYVISVKPLPFKVVKTIQLRYRPIEINCLKPTEGLGIYVYHVRTPDKPPKIDADILTRYDVRSIHWKRTLHLGLSGFVSAIKQRVGLK